MEKCPCGLNKSYEKCCGLLISGEEQAKTAVSLMRSRYSAYVKGEVAYIMETTHPERREENDERVIKNWSLKSQWHGLDIIKKEKGTANDDDGKVEFVAKYTQKGIRKEHHERALFKKEGDIWYFYDAEMIPQETFIRENPKIGRNDPCICGSGKKFKKCCG